MAEEVKQEGSIEPPAWWIDKFRLRVRVALAHRTSRGDGLNSAAKIARSNGLQERFFTTLTQGKNPGVGMLHRAGEVLGVNFLWLCGHGDESNMNDGCGEQSTAGVQNETAAVKQ